MIVVKIYNLKEDYGMGLCCLEGCLDGFFSRVCHCPKTKELVDDGCKCFPVHSFFRLYLCRYLVEFHMLTAGSVVLAIFFSLAKPT